MKVMIEPVCVPLTLLLLIVSTSSSCDHRPASPTRTARPVQAAVPAANFGPVAVFLTWQRDPTTTMTIDWHTETVAQSAILQYRASGQWRWQTKRVEGTALPMLKRTLFRTELTGLQAATTYGIRLGADSRVYSFRTMPRHASRPIRFVVGGDMMHRQAWMEETARQAARYDPDFVLIGGDLAYDDGVLENAHRWREWFAAVQNTLISPEGRIIPLLVTIGNHEVAAGYFANNPNFSYDADSRRRIAPFFYRLFAMPGDRGYNVLDFGKYLSVVLLDSDHTNPVDGDQTQWLEHVLAVRCRVTHVFPIYHVAAYPSVRHFEEEVSRRVREHWIPLFERYDVRVAFENHDHTYKRTYPLRDGRRNLDGVIYMGDGAWGVELKEIGRDQDEAPAWYLERAEEVRHFILVEIQGLTQRFTAVDHRGNVFDEYHVVQSTKERQHCPEPFVPLIN